MYAKKGPKRSKKGKLFGFSNFGGVFYFFPKNFENGLFFFFLEKFTLHSLTHFQRAEKKNSTGKKNNTIFTHSLDFCPKVVKNKLFQGKKNTIPLTLCSHYISHMPCARRPRKKLIPPLKQHF